MRFTIRDLLWLIVVVAMAVGWYYHSTSLWIVRVLLGSSNQGKSFLMLIAG